jgi:flagellar P-ring protein precursor FlgI
MTMDRFMNKLVRSFGKHGFYLVAAILAILMVLPNIAHATRVKEIANVSGQRSNQLIGYGLVVGLDGSGDQTTQSPFTLQSVISMLTSLGVALPPGQSIQMRNTAAVIVTAELPALARPGQKLDITVSSIGNAKSLKGGQLLMTPLRGADGQIYALGQGGVFVGGAGASSGGTSTTVNHLSVGRVPEGALVERAIPTAPMGQFVQLDLHQSDFTLMQRTAEAIAKRFGAGVVMPLDARALKVAVPSEPMARIRFLADLENLPIDTPAERAKVIVNARTGSVVMNQAVTLTPAAVAHGNLTVKIESQASVSQPEPFSRGQTTATSQASVQIEQGQTGPGGLVKVPQGANLDSVVRALNMLGAKPADLMSILQALKASGALKADLEVI